MDMETELAQEMHQEPSFPSTEFIPTEEAEPPIVSGLHKLRDPRTLVVIAVIGLFFLGMIAFLYFCRIVVLPIALAVMLSFFFSLRSLLIVTTVVALFLTVCFYVRH